MRTGAEHSKPEGIREPGSVGMFEGEHQLAAGVVIQDCRARCIIRRRAPYAGTTECAV